MDELLRKIYDDVLCYEKDIANMNQIIESETTHIIEKYEGKLTDEEEEEEELFNLLDTAASFAGKEGFCMGVKYTLKSILTLLVD